MNPSPEALPQTSPNPLIFVSLEAWDEVWRRNQFLCAHFARRHPDRPILFVEPPCDVSHALRRARLTRFWPTPPRALPDFPAISVFRPVKWWPNTLRWGRKLNQRAYRRQIRAAARGLKLRAPILWINDYSAAHCAGKLGEIGLIYDITDDWIAFEQAPFLRDLTRQQDAFLCRRADATLVCSQTLFDQKKTLAARLYLVPNGVESAHYAGVANRTQAPDRVTWVWRKPVLGYVGTIHSERVDVAMIEQVARAFPGGTLALVGPNALGHSDRKRLAALPNLISTGAVDHARVPGFLAAFDVCLTPHRETAFTQSLNPLKLWEYLATGLPIVSTNVAGFADFPALCHIASGETAFIAACHSALIENDDAPRAAHQKAARLEVARHNSWSARAAEIEVILAEINTGQGGSKR